MYSTPSYRHNINLEGYATRRGGVVTFGPWSTCYTCTIGWTAGSSAVPSNSPQPKIIYLYIGCSYKIQPALTKGSGFLGNASSSEPISIPYPSVGTPSTCPAASIIPVDSHCQIRGVADIGYHFKCLAFLCNRPTRSVKGLAVGSSPRGKGGNTLPAEVRVFPI